MGCCSEREQQQYLGLETLYVTRVKSNPYKQTDQDIWCRVHYIFNKFDKDGDMQLDYEEAKNFIDE